MEPDDSFPTGYQAVRQLARESRQFWAPERVRLAFIIVAAMLVVEVLVAAAFYAGTDGQTARGVEYVHTILVSLLGLTSGWAKALFTPEVHPEYADPTFEINLRDPYQLTASLLYDVAAMLRMWLLPLFAAMAFTGNAGEFAAGEKPLTRLWRRSAAAVGPLALIATVLFLAGILINEALPYAKAPVYQPSPYLSERVLLVPWRYIAENIWSTALWLAPAFVLIPTIAASWRDRQQALASCFGTSLFIVPVGTAAMLHFYPGGAYAAPPVAQQYATPLLSLVLFAVALPFALRRLRDEPSGAR